MIRLNFRESPPPRSQHIRGDARSLQAFRRCWFREASLRKWKFVLGHLQPVLGERQPVSFSRSVEQFPACSTQALARARNFSALGVGGAFGIVIHISPPSIFKTQKFQLFLPAAGSARYRLSPQSIV